MADREKVIGHLNDCMEASRRNNTWVFVRKDIVENAIELLKKQDKRYAMMVVDWLRDMAHNNYLDLSHMTFWDAILDIRERAKTGLENYFRDYDSDTKRQEGR